MIVVLCLISINLQGQTLVYDAFIHGHNVGQMKVTREVNDESTKISVDTHIEAHMLVTITVDFTSESTYLDNKLIVGEAKSSTNGHLKSSVHTVFKNGYYEVNIDGDVSTFPERLVQIYTSTRISGVLLFKSLPCCMLFSTILCV